MQSHAYFVQSPLAASAHSRLNSFMLSLVLLLRGTVAAPVRSGWLMQEHGFNAWGRDRFEDPPGSCAQICAHHKRTCSSERLAQAAGMTPEFARRFADGVPARRWDTFDEPNKPPSWLNDVHNRRIKEQLKWIGEVRAYVRRNAVSSLVSRFQAPIVPSLTALSHSLSLSCSFSSPARSTVQATPIGLPRMRRMVIPREGMRAPRATSK